MIDIIMLQLTSRCVMVTWVAYFIIGTDMSLLDLFTPEEIEVMMALREGLVGVALPPSTPDAAGEEDK